MRSISKPEGEVAARGQADSPTKRRLSGLSVVVPVFDEEQSLERVLAGTVTVAAAIASEWEVIVVDDGSRDRSAAIARRFAESEPHVKVLSHPSNRGFGAAQRTGFEACRQPFVTLVPADGQLDPAELAKLAGAFSAAQGSLDIAIGIRSDRPDGAYRKWKTRGLEWTMKRIFRLELKDINWVKMYRRSALESLELRADGIGIEAEIVVKAARRGMEMVEVDLGYRRRLSGLAKGDQMRPVLVTLWELMRLRCGWL